MEFEKLFSVVVLSGAMLATGCGKKEAGNTSAATPAETTTEAAATPVETAPAATEATPRLEGPPRKEAPKLTQNGESCDDICTEQTSDGELICPIPDGDGGTNCCWLMIPKHECCPT